MNNEYPVDKFQDKAIIINENLSFSKNFFLVPSKYLPYIENILIPKGMLVDRIEKLAENILKDFCGQQVVFIVVLKGALITGNYLSEHLGYFIKNHSYSLDYVFDFITISSYVDDKSTGNVTIRTDNQVLGNITNKNVIIVEDVYDSGLTMHMFIKLLETYSPASIKSMVLLQKMNFSNLKYTYEIDYLGFLIPNHFIIGFGLDYNEQFRYLDHLCTINEEGIAQFKINKE